MPTFSENTRTFVLGAPSDGEIYEAFHCYLHAFMQYGTCNASSCACVQGSYPHRGISTLVLFIILAIFPKFLFNWFVLGTDFEILWVLHLAKTVLVTKIAKYSNRKVIRTCETYMFNTLSKMCCCSTADFFVSSPRFSNASGSNSVGRVSVWQKTLAVFVSQFWLSFRFMW